MISENRGGLTIQAWAVRRAHRPDRGADDRRQPGRRRYARGARAVDGPRTDRAMSDPTVRCPGPAARARVRRARRGGRDLRDRARADPRPRRRIGQRQDDDRAGAARLPAAAGSAQRGRHGRDRRRVADRALRAQRCGACAAGSSRTCRRSLRWRSTPRSASATQIAAMLRAHGSGQSRRECRRARRCGRSTCRTPRAFSAALPASALRRAAAARRDCDRARLPSRRSSSSTSPRPASTSSPRRAAARDPPAAPTRPGWRSSTSRTTSRSSARSPTGSR